MCVCECVCVLCCVVLCCARSEYSPKLFYTLHILLSGGLNQFFNMLGCIVETHRQHQVAASEDLMRQEKRLSLQIVT